MRRGAGPYPNPNPNPNLNPNRRGAGLHPGVSPILNEDGSAQSSPSPVDVFLDGDERGQRHARGGWSRGGWSDDDRTRHDGTPHLPYSLSHSPVQAKPRLSAAPCDDDDQVDFDCESDGSEASGWYPEPECGSAGEAHEYVRGSGGAARSRPTGGACHMSRSATSPTYSQGRRASYLGSASSSSPLRSPEQTAERIRELATPRSPRWAEQAARRALNGSRCGPGPPPLSTSPLAGSQASPKRAPSSRIVAVGAGGSARPVSVSVSVSGASATPTLDRGPRGRAPALGRRIAQT